MGVLTWTLDGAEDWYRLLTNGDPVDTFMSLLFMWVFGFVTIVALYLLYELTLLLVQTPYDLLYGAGNVLLLTVGPTVVGVALLVGVVKLGDYVER